MSFYQYRKLFRNEKILVGCDISDGVDDYTVCQFLSRQELDVPLVYRERIIGTEMTTKLYPVLEKIYDKTGIEPLAAYERNKGGDRDIETLAKLNKHRKYKIYEMKKFGDIDEKAPTKLGWDTNSATRPIMLTALKEAIDNHFIRIYDKTTIEELFSFIKVRTSSITKAQAEANCYDDCVMALAIAWQLYLDPQSEADSDTITASMQEHQRNIDRMVDTGGTGY